jgi:predicted methyltransferase
VLVVEESVDVLERLQASTKVTNVFYLVGFPEVLPLTDASVDEVLATAPPTGEAAAEFFRVLRSGGRVAIATRNEDPAASALNLDAREVERLFNETGFADVTVASAHGRLAVAAHKP